MADAGNVKSLQNSKIYKFLYRTKPDTIIIMDTTTGTYILAIMSPTLGLYLRMPIPIINGPFIIITEMKRSRNGVKTLYT